MVSQKSLVREFAFIMDFFIVGFLWSNSIGNVIPYDIITKIDADRTLEWLFLVIITIIYVLMFSIYSILFLGRFGATIGKMVFGLKVVDEDGKPISYRLATKRTYLLIKLGVPWFMFGDKKEESPHDKKLNLHVIRNPLFKK